MYVAVIVVFNIIIIIFSYTEYLFAMADGSLEVELHSREQASINIAPKNNNGVTDYTDDVPIMKYANKRERGQV